MKVLIVEDDPISRELFRTVVFKEGYTMQVAEDGIDGLEKFNEFLPDIVISDIRMPRLDGIELLKRIRSIEKNVIIIIITAHGNEEIALEALQAGANNYLKKPVNLEDLKILLSRYKHFIHNKTVKKDITTLIQNRNISMEIDPDFDIIPTISEYLTNIVKYLFPTTELISIELGLSELLLNAIEHGCFQITSEEKETALRDNSLLELYNNRKNDAVYGSRKISITFEQTKDSCSWTISDQGKGFDWQYVPSPISERLISKLHGRGIFISKLQFDSIEFSGNGNTVTARKYLHS